jgi:hypothetical protein
MDVIALVLIGLGVAAAITATVRIAATLAARNTPDELLGTDVEARRLDDLAVRKTALVAAIRTTELDFETGKVSQTDRDRTLRRLENEAVVVMKTMDDIRGAEVDRDAAEHEIAEFLERRLGAATGDEAWSAAARMRHGGRLPSTEVRP